MTNKKEKAEIMKEDIKIKLEQDKSLQWKAYKSFADTWSDSGKDAFNFTTALSDFAVDLFYKECGEFTGHANDSECDFKLATRNMTSDGDFETCEIVLVKNGTLFYRTWDGTLKRISPRDLFPTELLYLIQYVKDSFVEGDLPDNEK